MGNRAQEAKHITGNEYHTETQGIQHIGCRPIVLRILRKYVGKGGGCETGCLKTSPESIDTLQTVVYHSIFIYVSLITFTLSCNDVNDRGKNVIFSHIFTTIYYASTAMTTSCDNPITVVNDANLERPSPPFQRQSV